MSAQIERLQLVADMQRLTRLAAKFVQKGNINEASFLLGALDGYCTQLQNALESGAALVAGHAPIFQKYLDEA